MVVHRFGSQEMQQLPNVGLLRLMLRSKSLLVADKGETHIWLVEPVFFSLSQSSHRKVDLTRIISLIFRRSTW
jgi:hypothetical protein